MSNAEQLGLHEIEVLPESQNGRRMRVPGGWIYFVNMETADGYFHREMAVFVPEPAVLTAVHVGEVKNDD